VRRELPWAAEIGTALLFWSCYHEKAEFKALQPGLSLGAPPPDGDEAPTHEVTR